MVDFRLNDGYLAAFPFDISSDPGDWRPVGWPFALPDPRADPDAWVANEEAVPHPSRVAVPVEGAERAHESRL